MTDRTIIVGGGFSGTMVAAQLARAGRASLVIDDAPRAARGAAYGTADPQHRLNVPAGRMSAWPDRPSDFADWLEGNGRAAPGGFANRADYGDYLEAIFAEAVASGRTGRREGRAERVAREGAGWRVTLADGEVVEGTALVLATGNPPPEGPRALAAVGDADRIDQPWGEAAMVRLRAAAANGEAVLVVGTSLTMVDVALSLDAMGHPGPVVAVSRRGLIPRAHAEQHLAAPAAPDVATLPTRLSHASRWLRGQAAAAPDWRLTMEAVRGVTRRWWQRLDDDTRRRFLRHARPWWDVHRHRLAPDVARRIEALRDAGWLRVVAGRVTGARAADGGYRVDVACRGDGIEEIGASAVVDCTGPGSVLDRAPVAGMLADGLAEPDAFGLGVKVDEVGRIVGTVDAYAIGTLARGSRWETTAVPDLRGQAQAIAEAIAGETGTTRG